MTLMGVLMWVIPAAAGILLAASLLHYRQTRNIYRPLSSRQPERREQDVPLGYEALDMDAVRKVNRRNEALERGHTNWTRHKAGHTAVADTDIDPQVDDANYATRYYKAFNKDRSKEDR